LVLIGRLLDLLRQWTRSPSVYARVPPLSSNVGMCRNGTEAQRNPKEMLQFLFRFLVPLFLVPEIFSASLMY
jgi:hypothetical protein